MTWRELFREFLNDGMKIDSGVCVRIIQHDAEGIPINARTVKVSHVMSDGVVCINQTEIDAAKME